MQDEAQPALSPWYAVWGMTGISLVMLALQQASSHLCLGSRSWFTQPWHLWTAHLVHVNYPHLLLNLAGLFSLLFFFRDNVFTALVITILVLAPVISIILSLTLPAATCYYGFSGLLHTLYVALAISMLGQKKDRPWAIGLLVLFLLKLVSDHYGGNFSQKILHADISHEAHQLGSIAGLVLGLFLFCLDWASHPHRYLTPKPKITGDDEGFV